MQIIIPMAGEGKRFSEKGFKLPKPVIHISGIPMIIKLIRNLPSANKWVFMVKQEHIDNYKIDELIKKENKKAIIISIKKTTQGQACTCMLAEPYINPEEELIIANCDIGFLYDKKRFDKLRKRKDVDSIIWTFTKREILRKKPKSWGWYELEKDRETIKKVSVKKPVSNNPYNDQALTGLFYFKKAKYFFNATNLMFKENYRTNNEFYVDGIPKFLKKLNKKSVIFEVDLFVCFGIPEDVHDYEKMEFIIKNNIIPTNLSKEEKRLLPLWRRYVKK